MMVYEIPATVVPVRPWEGFINRDKSEDLPQTRLMLKAFGKKSAGSI